MSRRMRCGALILITMVLVAFVLFLPSFARRSLPWNASEIREHYSDARFGSDFTRCLRAKIGQADFIAYADRLDLLEPYDAQNPKHAKVRWPSCSETWWTPPPSLDGARIQLLRDPNYYALAKYEDGYVYFGVISW
jgi:hypothetical protein